jgi:hypothetical protein
MGLERRGNNFYFYEKERRGNRVYSVYSGKGDTALLLSRLNECRREENEGVRDSFRLEAQKHEHIDRLVEQFCESARSLETAMFLINGYHQHSRQWRRKQTKE